MKKKAVPKNEQPVALPNERSGKAEFTPDVMRRFAALVEEMKAKHGLSDEALAAKIGWSEFGISRLRKNNGGLTAGPAIGLTQFAELDYESFVIHGVRVKRGAGFDVRDLPSFQVARARIGEHAQGTVEMAADMLSVARPRSVTLAMLDHACSLVSLVNLAPPELRGTDLRFATAHEDERKQEEARLPSRRGKNATNDDGGGSVSDGVRRLGHRP